MTGMSISGKMSVGIFQRIMTTPRMAISIAITTKVYGLRKASRTIHMSYNLLKSPCTCRVPPLSRFHQFRRLVIHRMWHLVLKHLAQRIHRRHQRLALLAGEALKFVFEEVLRGLAGLPHDRLPPRADRERHMPPIVLTGPALDESPLHQPVDHSRDGRQR